MKVAENNTMVIWLPLFRSGLYSSHIWPKKKCKIHLIILGLNPLSNMVIKRTQQTMRCIGGHFTSRNHGVLFVCTPRTIQPLGALLVHLNASQMQQHAQPRTNTAFFIWMAKISQGDSVPKSRAGVAWWSFMFHFLARAAKSIFLEATAPCQATPEWIDPLCQVVTLAPSCSPKDWCFWIQEFLTMFQWSGSKATIS